MPLCKDCSHRRPNDGYRKVKEKHVPRKVDKNGKVTSYEEWKTKKK